MKRAQLFFSVAFPIILLAFTHESAAQVAEFTTTTFYLHTSYGRGGVRRLIMSTAPPYGIQQSASAPQELVFALEPRVSVAARISGAVTFNLWLVAESVGVGIVNATLTQNFGAQNSSLVASVESPIVISSQIRAQPYSLAVGPIAQTLHEGSTLQLRITVRQATTRVVLLWDGTEVPSHIVIPFTQRYYYRVKVATRDTAGRPLSNANLTILEGDRTVWTGRTNATGEAMPLLPYGDKPPVYTIWISWMDRPVNIMENVEFVEGLDLILPCRVHDLTVVVRDLLGVPLSGASVTLMVDERDLVLKRTGYDGEATFTQIPEGAFTIQVNDETSRLARIGITVQAPMRLEVPTRVMQAWFRYVLVASFLSLMGAALIFSKRTLRPHRTKFGFLIELLGGEIPKASTLMIVGNPASGKTVLMQKLMHTSLVGEGKCLFVSNQEFPEKILDDMESLGLDARSYLGSSLLFVDWYSGTAGKRSSEKLSVSSLSDLTGLGTQLSKGISMLGDETHVFLDSTSPLLAVVANEQVLSFIHAIGARVKGQGGTLFFSLGVGLDPDFLARLESMCDCVIQVESNEVGTEVKRRLRIRKLRGQQHLETWIEFSVEPREGLVFYTTKRMA